MAKIKGANKADKQNIALARQANKDDKVAARDEAKQTHTHLATPAEEAAAKAGDANKTTADVKKVVQRGEDTPEAAETPREARDKAEKLFQKANEAGQAGMIAVNTASRAVRGY